MPSHSADNNGRAYPTLYPDKEGRFEGMIALTIEATRNASEQGGSHLTSGNSGGHMTTIGTHMLPAAPA